MLYQSLRDRQADLIRQNPASITITRTTRTAADDGGWTEATTTLAAQTMRLYDKNTRMYNSNDGGWVTARMLKLVAKYDANVRAEDETYLDKFTYGGKVYKITDVKDIYTQGYIVFKECGLEEVT